MIEFLIEKMEKHRDETALAMPTVSCSYGDLLARVRDWHARLASLPHGRVVSVEGDYGPDSIAVFLAATWAGHVVVPLSPDSRAHHQTCLEVGAVEYRIRPEAGTLEATGRVAAHPLFDALRGEGHPGLLLFSSGSTGTPKAALHDLARLLAKYRVARQRFRTLVFLLLDHIGGVNTLFYTLSNGGAVVLSADRSPSAVCEAIETHRVELLPTSPTFLNLLLLSGDLSKHDVSSLRLITYGTEPMPASTLEQACKALPNVRFLQTYGLTELGILRSQSRDSNSLWVRVGGEDFESKVVDGRLWIRAKSAMLGYLNAPSPFDAEGYFDTGDLVEVDGEWIRFLGRTSEIINVGGNKVHPTEVESTLLQMEGVADVVVRGQPNPLTGQIVVATVQLTTGETIEQFKIRMRQFCADRLAAYKVPASVRITDKPVYSARFKRIRKSDAASIHNSN
jgi:acyl-CoA synthetase (AMP-forming)/AMP-acid ligase II